MSLSQTPHACCFSGLLATKPPHLAGDFEFDIEKDLPKSTKMYLHNGNMVSNQSNTKA